MSQSQALYRLQTVEAQIDAVEKRLEEIQSILENDAAIVQAREQVDASEAQIRPIEANIREIEFEVETASTKAADTEARLYDGSVTNTKEMQEMQQEIVLLRERQAGLEEDILSLMMELEDAEATLEQHRGQLERVTRSRAAENQTLVLEQERKTAELDALNRERAEMIDNLTDEARSIYEQMRARTKGIFIAKMTRDGTCELCGVQQDRATEKAVRSGQIVQCNSCRRVLVFM